MKQVKFPTTDEYTGLSIVFRVHGFFGSDGLLNTIPLVMNRKTYLILPVNLSNTPNYI